MMRAYQYLGLNDRGFDEPGLADFTIACVLDFVSREGSPAPTALPAPLDVGSWLVYVPEAGFTVVTDARMRRWLTTGQAPSALYERPDDV